MANEMTFPTLTHCEVNKPEIIQEIAVEETEDTIEILCSNKNSKKDRGFLIVYEMFSSYHMIRGGNTTSVISVVSRILVGFRLYSEKK